MVADEYDFWVLDLDGTLIDVEESYRRELLDRVGARLGCSFSEWEAIALWHSSDLFRQQQILSKYDTDVETFWDVFDEIDDPIARAEASYLFEDAETIATVNRPTGIVTHCPPEVAGTVLDTLDIADWFETVVCCTAETGWKPDPDPVQRAVGEMTMDENGTRGVLIGDGPDDIGAAWNAGLDGICIDRYGADLRGFCVVSDRRVTTITEV